MTRKNVDWDARIGRRITLKDLHILSYAVRFGSMAKAAVQLSTTQSVVSGAVANLEATLGVRMLDRSSRGVEPTIYARALLNRSNIVFDELREAVREIETLSHSAAGDVRVAYPEFMAGGLIAEVITAFATAYPDITCDAVEADVNTLEFRLLHERRVDVMVTRVPATFTDPALEIEVLFEDPHVVVAGATHRLAGRSDMTLADLASERWVLPGAVVMRQVVTESFERLGLPPPKASVICSPLLMRRQLLESGQFLTVLPMSVLSRGNAVGTLTTLPVQLSGKAPPVAMVSIRDRTVSPAVALFAEHVRATARDYEVAVNAPVMSSGEER